MGAAVVLAIACGGSTAAGASSSPSPGVARQLSLQAAAPWPGLQRADGSFTDAVRYPTPYGEAILGYGLLSTGLREHDDRLIGSALRACGWVLEHRFKRKRQSVFQNWSMAASYNLARRAIPNDPRFRRLVPRWQSLLRAQTLRRLNPAKRYGNHQLVEALEVLELEKTGLRSSVRKAIVGPMHAESLRRAVGLINKRIPAMAAAGTIMAGGKRTFLLSDPPDEPMAYQGLSLGMYARAIQLLGRKAAAVTTSVLRRVAEASWRLAAPDGDLGYMGRNQEEAWVLSATAFGAHQAAAAPGPPLAGRSRAEGVAVRALHRLFFAHLGGPDGLYIVPALSQNFAAGKRAVDLSAGSAEFVGLTLVYLNFLAASPAAGPAPGGVAADSDGTSVLGHGESLRAVVRHGDVWFATRAMPSVVHDGDFRYDPGLIALKQRTSDGAWRDVIPTRPRVTLGARSDSTGPLLRTARGRAVLSASRIERRPGGAVELVGAYQRLGSGRPIGRGGVERIEPVACGGAQVSFSVRKGDLPEYSVFLHDRPGTLAVGPDSVASGGTRVTFTPGAQVQVRRGYVSASDPFVLRVRLRWKAATGRLLKVAVCDVQ